MPILLDRVPIPELPSEVIVRGDRVRRDQILVWVTVTSPRAGRRGPGATPFPAILDTGYTHMFAAQERHLSQWAGLNPDEIPVIGAGRDQGRRIALHAADVWVHRNQTGSLDRLVAGPPFGLAVTDGIAIYPSAGNFPRLPLLGLRALTRNRLVLTVDGGRRRATLRTALNWWPFAG